jgi:hypothetical protein
VTELEELDEIRARIREKLKELEALEVRLKQFQEKIEHLQHKEPPS